MYTKWLTIKIDEKGKKTFIENEKTGDTNTEEKTMETD